ncbi:MAG TPA: 5'/3'-nucleotidase SurE [Acidimicrobiales bacterium]|nr:5'/3'-nucleotidase SurE [Acidimicrobiales bacterium]
MRVLVTNDDGVHAAGILALATALVADGHDVVVAAPLDDMSGSAAALGPGHSSGVRVEALVLADLGEAVPVFGVDGPPGMCVMAAHLEAFGPRPEIVASGVNHGSNTGRSVLFSGTVGAALAAASFGMRGVAVSAKEGDPWRFATAAAFGAAAVRWAETSPEGTVLNVNVPSLPLAEVRGVRSGTLAPFGVVQTVLEGRDHERLNFVLRSTDEQLPADADTALVNAGFVSVNALVGPRAVDAGDASAAMETRLARRQVNVS